MAEAVSVAAMATFTQKKPEPVLTDDQKAALRQFSLAVRNLKDCGVIRSDRYLGDIAEFLCARAFGIDLVTNLREVGHDGMRGQLRVQVKYGGGKKTNMDFGNPDEYDEVYVVLGEGSVIRSREHAGDFLVYILTAEQVRTMRCSKGKHTCGRRGFSREPDHIINLSDLAPAAQLGRLA